jgi:putative FmdB family regulatory protein
MPTYEYICAACDHAFEAFQSFSDKPIKKCPECKKNKVEKSISGGAGLVFKGEGFYETDYNRGKGSEYKKKADSEKGSKDKNLKKNSKTNKKSTKNNSEKK